MLGEFEARLSDVPRWGIVRTIQKQSVDQHSFRVALMVTRLAVEFFGVAADDYETLYKLSRYAMLHDQDESFSGDMPSPAKFAIDEVALAEKFASRVLETPELPDNLKVIVKIADIVEAIIFMHHEIMMGNSSVHRIQRSLVDALSAAVLKSDAMPDMVDIVLFRAMEHEAQQDPLGA